MGEDPGYHGLDAGDLDVKKTLCLLTGAVLLFFLAGCASALTPQEYLDGLTDGFHEYVAASKEISAALDAKTYDDTAIGPARDALNSISALSPPSEYADLHKTLCESIMTELEWLDAVAEFCRLGKDDPTNTAEIEKTVQKLSEIAESSKFPENILNTVITVRGDLE